HRLVRCFWIFSYTNTHMNLKLSPCIRFKLPLLQRRNDAGISRRISRRLLYNDFPNAACAKIKDQTEEAGRHRVIGRYRLGIIRLKEVDNVVAPGRGRAMGGCDDPTVGSNTA